MPDIKIKFSIDNPDSSYKNAWDIEGGLLIEKNNLILTQRVDDVDDDGFRGDYVFFNLMDWLTSTPELIANKICRCQLVDGGGTFVFEPKNNLTYFKYFIEGTGQLTENENKRYPNHEEGTPIKTEELVLEIIRISELFIESFGSKINDKSDVISFKQALDDARESYELYLKKNTQN